MCKWSGQCGLSKWQMAIRPLLPSRSRVNTGLVTHTWVRIFFLMSRVVTKRRLPKILLFNIFFHPVVSSDWTSACKEFLKIHLQKITEQYQHDYSLAPHASHGLSMSSSSTKLDMKYWNYATQLTRHLFEVWRSCYTHFSVTSAWCCAKHFARFRSVLGFVDLRMLSLFRESHDANTHM